MASSESERTPCPNCGKRYRWRPELAKRKVACKACGTEFIFPDELALAAPAPPEDDAGLYELASDPEEERDLPPAFKPQPCPPQTPVLPDEPIDSTVSEDSVEEADKGEPEIHASEAAKAARREAQRIAAAEEQAVRTWRDYKWLWVVLGLLVLLIIIYWGIYKFSDAMEDGLHNTIRPEHRELITISITPDQGERL